MIVTLELNDYEAEVIRDVLNESLFRTSLGFENFNLEDPETAARVATMYVVVTKINEELS